MNIRMDISRKINVLFIAGLVAMAVMAWLLSTHYMTQAKKEEISAIRSLLFEEREKQALNLVENAYSVIETADFYETARNALREMRYGRDDQLYFFVVDVDGMFFVQPAHPEMEGKVALDLEDASGKQFIREIVEIAKRDGQGSVEYVEAVEGADAPVTKRGHFKLFKSWGWILCTGVPIDDIDTIAKSKERAIEASFSKHMEKYVLCIVCMGVFLIALSRLLVRWKIVSPIKRATAMMEDIAQGEADLTRRLKVESQDEIGQWAASFNTFVENTQAMIREIMVHAQSLHCASGEMRVVTDSLAAGTDQTSVETHWVANSVNDMNLNLSDAAASLNQTAATVRQISASAVEMDKLVTASEHKTVQAREISHNAVMQALGASEKILDLDSMASHIREINEAIAEINEQINLLSVNAAIEAAKSGEAGKGFQVVAREMKELSGQTGEASRRIRSQIKHIQETSSRTIGEVESITGIIHSINSLVEELANAAGEQAKLTRAMAQDIRETSFTLDNVNDNVASCSQSTRLIVRKISEVNLTAGEMAQGNQNLIQNASMLTSMADQLQTMVFRFKTGGDDDTGRIVH